MMSDFDWKRQRKNIRTLHHHLVIEIFIKGSPTKREVLYMDSSL
jgi:hypothetical protein